MTDITLKPCPFCGGQAEFQDGSIKCSKCGLNQRHHVLHDSSVEAWNTRCERTCRFTLESDRDAMAGRANTKPSEWTTCDNPLAWTCSVCGHQYSPVYPFPTWLKHCPECGAKVVSE